MPKRLCRSFAGQLATVKATREVIVSGSVLNTPQILKLSGVRLREELVVLGIVVVDLPAVGSYLNDNYEGGSSLETAEVWGAVNPITHSYADDLSIKNALSTSIASKQLTMGDSPSRHPSESQKFGNLLFGKDVLALLIKFLWK